MKLYWLIDRLIDSYIDWSLTEPSWDGRGLTSGLIQYDPIQYSLCFFFFSCANLCGTERTEKQQRHTWINNSSDPVTLHELKVCVRVCLRLWGTGLTGFKWGFEVQHCHLRTGLDAAGCRQITSSCWGHWCVFLRCCGSDKEKQGQLYSVRERLRRKFKGSVCGTYVGKGTLDVLKFS